MEQKEFWPDYQTSGNIVATDNKYQHDSRVKPDYRMSFTIGGLVANESIEVARLHEPGGDWSDTLKCALSERIMTMPKEVSNRRILREIISRLKTLSEEDLEFLVDSDFRDQKNMLWVAVCRTYRIIGEFQREVVNDLYLSGRDEVSPLQFDRFLWDKVEIDQVISQPSDSTCNNLKRSLFRMMRDAEIIGPENQLWGCILSSQFVNHLVKHDRSAVCFFSGGERWMPEMEPEQDDFAPDF